MQQCFLHSLFFIYKIITHSVDRQILCIVCMFEGVRMHTVNGRQCEVKKALPRDDQSLTASNRSSSKLD